MKNVGFSEFRRNASHVFDLVEKGETIRILRHGKAVARIVPADGLELERAWKQPGLRLAKPGLSLSKAVLEERRPIP